MRPWPLALMLLGAVAAAVPGVRNDDWTVLIGGDTDGYLSPCGCTKPMTGGIRRRATAIAALRNERTLVLENGGLVAGRGRQDELKAETMAEFLASVGADAIHVTGPEAKLGKGMLLSLANLAEGRLLSTSLVPSDLPIRPFVAKGPFWVGGASLLPGLPSVGIDVAAQKLVDEAGERTPVLMLSGGLDEARALAKKNPQIDLIIYRSHGSPPDEPIKEGETWLVSPGEKGRYLLSLRFSEGQFAGYTPVKLGPEYGDEAGTQGIYKAYLRRVEQEDLLGQIPRHEGPEYVGSERCGTCHQQAFQVWKSSRHARALVSLEKVGHAKDPDCVGCHVVGLRSVQGFVSREKTPKLANVGCESCHGAGKAHTLAPKKTKMAKGEPKDCVSCHDPENSPNFDFSTYWPRIRH